MDQVALKRATHFLVVEGTVLHIGCGDGSTGKLLPNCQEYWGIDAKYLSDNPRMLRAEYGTLPFEPNSFDTVLITEALKSAEEPTHLLAEACRVLVPSGKLAIASVSNKWQGSEELTNLIAQYFEIRSTQIVGGGNATILVNAEKKTAQRAQPKRISAAQPSNKAAVQPSRPLVSFIVSAYNRPMLLEGALISLCAQTHSPAEIIVTDNSDARDVLEKNRMIAAKYGARYIGTRELGAVHCYESAECGLPFARGEWLAFPSDDCYYVPGFAEILIDKAEANKWDLVYCDIVMDPRMFRTPPRWDVLHVEPRSYHIDKNCFAVRRSKFQGFPDKGVIGDGRLIDSLVSRGLKHGKAPGVLVVHN